MVTQTKYFGAYQMVLEMVTKVSERVTYGEARHKKDKRSVIVFSHQNISSQGGAMIGTSV